MKNLKNTLVALTMILIATFSLTAQTINNFKIEHNPSKLYGKIHLVNTSDCRWDTLLPSLHSFPDTPNGVIKLVDYYSILYGYGSIDSMILNKTNIGDTVLTFNFVLPESTILPHLYLNTLHIVIIWWPSTFYPNTVHEIDSYLLFTDFITHPTYLPCYVSVDPVLGTPTIKWESIDNNAIEKYIIKRNGHNIDTVNFSSGIMSYNDVNNHDAINYVQTYTLEAIDSTGLSRSGGATTIHARNLASVNGNVELDWNIPTVAGTITSFDIYEYDATLDVLTFINNVPSTITQYTVTNPDVTKMYIVGVPNIDCTGSAIHSANTSLLSNPVHAIGAAGIQALTINKNDEIIGYFDLMGRKVDPNISNQVVIVKYKSGKTEKKLN